MRLRFLVYYILLSFIFIGCSSVVKNKASQDDNLAESIQLRRSKVDNSVLFNVRTSDPVMLRALLMQGFELHLFSANDTTIVMLPSAQDVSDKVEHHPGEVKATIQNNREKRPDIRPLVIALNEAGFTLSTNKEKSISMDSYRVSVNQVDGELSYEIIIPDSYLPGKNFKTLLLSRPNAKMMMSAEFDKRHYENVDVDNNPQPFGVNAIGEESANDRVIRIEF